MPRRRMSSENEVIVSSWAIFGSLTKVPLPRRRIEVPFADELVEGGAHGQARDAEVDAQLPLGGDRLPDREPLDQLEHLVARLGLLGHPDSQVVSASPSATSSCSASYSADRQVVNTNTGKKVVRYGRRP